MTGARESGLSSQSYAGAHKGPPHTARALPCAAPVAPSTTGPSSSASPRLGTELFSPVIRAPLGAAPGTPEPHLRGSKDSITPQQSTYQKSNDVYPQ